MITVALVDDHTLFRMAFSFFIKSACGFNVCMEAVNGDDLLNQLSICDAYPKIVLSDIMMPVMNGRELTLTIKKLYTDINVIALSSLHHEDIVIDMFRCGAKGFITKNVELEDLVKALHAVINNQYFLFDGENKNIFSSYHAILSDKTRHGLTEKQIQFLQLCASDLTYKSIAERLQISPRTVDAYRDNLFEKLNIKSRSGLVLYAVQNGFIEL